LAVSVTPQSTTTSDHSEAPRSLIIMVVALFFIWGGLTSLNDILIPKLKGLFSLSYAEVMLTQFAFFAAYFIVSLPAGALIARIGYLKGIVIGLGVMALGCVMFVPAAGSGIYATFLVSLFVLAAGITILQVAANPLIANLGSAATSHSRLTLAQAFNSLGTTVFPLVGAQLILGSLNTTDPATLSGEALTTFQATEAAVVGHAYIAIAIVLAIVAAIFWMRRAELGSGRGEHISLAGSFALLSRPRLALGVASIFLYVGAEVSIGSLLVNYLSQPGVMGLAEKAAGSMIAFYWGGAMIGRFIGSFALRLFAPGKVLASVAVGAAALAIVSAMTHGNFAGWALLAVGLMNAIMFPTIFSLGVEGLGERTPQASGLLCMAIVGGALIPLLTGVVADHTTLATSLIVPAVCYLMVATYGWIARHPADVPTVDPIITA
jgi:FHS family L-fucose permease-like MFS transporter